MTNNSDKKSFWTTLPGILAAIAAILTAMVALIGFISPPPVISYFDSSPDTISPGHSSNLSWNVSDATSVTIDPEIGRVELTGTRVVSPAETTDYTLKVKNIFGKDASFTVIVFVQNVPEEDLPVINYFEASPSAISAGEGSTLRWSVSDATNVTLDPEIGSVALTGTRLVSPTETTTYTLTATNEAGKRDATVKVVIGVPPDETEIKYFKASPSEIKPDESATLSWDVSDAASVTIDPEIGDVGLTDTKVVSPTKTTTYTLTATNDAGKDVDTTTVKVVDVGVLSEKPEIKYFKASPSEIKPDESATLSWDVSDAASVTIDPEIGDVGLTDTKVVSPTKTTTYTLTATNDAGSVDDTVEVIVGPGVTEIDRILGTVTYRGTPVEGIPIGLIASSECDVTKVDQRTYTDAQGRYFFLGISPGSYRIAINGWGGTDDTVEPYGPTCTWELEKKASSALTLDWTLHKTDLQITFPIEDTSIDSISPTFRWDAYPYATRYKIILIQVSPSRETIEWDTPTESTSFTSESPLTPGARYNLIVWAWDSTGQIAYGNVYFSVK